MRERSPVPRPLRRAASRGATLVALVCLCLALLAQGAEWAHRHPDRIGCGEAHDSHPPRACAPGEGETWLAAGAPPAGSPSGGTCLVCRWSRGPLVPAPARASLLVLSASGPRLAPSEALDPASAVLSGSPTRAPPARG